MDPRIERAVTFIEENLSSTLRVGQLACQTGVSRSRFQHLIRQETGRSFQALVREIRLNRAKELLANKDLQLKAIASMVGYKYPANFTRDFRRRFGDTPSRYRALLLDDTIC